MKLVLAVTAICAVVWIATYLWLLANTDHDTPPEGSNA